MKSAKAIPIMSLVTAVIALGLTGCGDTGGPSNPTPTALISTTEPTPESRDTSTEEPTQEVTEEPTSEPTEAISDVWITFTSEADGFAIDMPGEPQASTQTADSPLGKITFYFFQLADGEAQYVVSYNDYPVPLEELNAEQLLSDAIEGAAQGGEVENVQTIEVQGNTGIEGEMTVQEATHVWYRGILVKNRLYQLIVSAPEADNAEFADEAQRFFESFTLLGE